MIAERRSFLYMIKKIYTIQLEFRDGDSGLLSQASFNQYGRVDYGWTKNYAECLWFSSEEYADEIAEAMLEKENFAAAEIIEYRINDGEIVQTGERTGDTSPANKDEQKIDERYKFSVYNSVTNEEFYCATIDEVADKVGRKVGIIEEHLAEVDTYNNLIPEEDKRALVSIDQYVIKRIHKNRHHE